MGRAALPPIEHERIAGVIDRVIGSFIARGELHRDEVDDLRSAVMLRVLQKLNADDGEAVHSADDYIARMTINAVNDVLRSRRTAPAPLTGDEDAIDDAPEPQEAYAARQLLTLLWTEVGALPLPQRRALLLQARDENGGSVIPLLVFTGLATLDEVAAILGFTRAQIEELWDRLPMADLDIAARLDMTRPQVISLRRAARERLERARQRLAWPRGRAK